jgi:hypothetical protein
MVWIGSADRRRYHRRAECPLLETSVVTEVQPAVALAQRQQPCRWCRPEILTMQALPRTAC